jgi:hypothetical protein
VAVWTEIDGRWRWDYFHEIRLSIMEHKALVALAGDTLSGWTDPPEAVKGQPQSLSVLINIYHDCIERLVPHFYCDWPDFDSTLIPSLRTFRDNPHDTWSKWGNISQVLYVWGPGNFYPWIKTAVEGSPSDYGAVEKTDRFIGFHILQMRAALEHLNTIALCTPTAGSGEQVPFESPGVDNKTYPVVYQGGSGFSGAYCKLNGFTCWLDNIAPFTKAHPEGDSHQEFVYNRLGSGQDRSVEFRGGLTFAIPNLGGATPASAQMAMSFSPDETLKCPPNYPDGVHLRLNTSSGANVMACGVDQESGYATAAETSDASWISQGNKTLVMVPSWKSDDDGCGLFDGVNGNSGFTFTPSGPLIVTFQLSYHS